MYFCFGHTIFISDFSHKQFTYKYFPLDKYILLMRWGVEHVLTKIRNQNRERIRSSEISVPRNWARRQRNGRALSVFCNSWSCQTTITSISLPLALSASLCFLLCNIKAGQYDDKRLSKNTTCAYPLATLHTSDPIHLSSITLENLYRGSSVVPK